MESLLPLFDRFLSPAATQYAVCIYKVRAPESPEPGGAATADPAAAVRPLAFGARPAGRPRLRRGRSGRQYI